ncbi:biotin transporter BioY [bacterium]|nr:biotin transporter BioY [bacterium]
MERLKKKWCILWKTYYRNLEKFSVLEKISLSFIFTVLTGFSAQIFIKLPFTPVPITGQVFVVLLSGILLGKNYGSLSQILYLTGGILGIRWFAGGHSGLLTPTGGYIIGFIFASYLIGFFSEKRKDMIFLMYVMLAGISVMYLSGMLWLAFYLKISLKKAFYLGVLPFIPVDIIKSYIAGIISHSIIKNQEGV